jgi:GTP-binding protein Era
MNRSAESSLSDVQLVLFVVEGTHWQEDDELTLGKIKRSGLPTVLVINKVDKFSGKEVMLPFIDRMSRLHDFREIIPVSAVQGTNVEQLKEIVRSYLPESEFIFPDDYVTDRPVRFMVSEIIREKLMRLTGDELPYAVTVEIESYKDEPKMVRIAAAILVDKPNQKKMIIGSEGSKIKQVGIDARKDIEEMLGRKVFLELWVKVKKGWADDERALKSLGYMDKGGFD